jgi:hypothetical protein
MFLGGSPPASQPAINQTKKDGNIQLGNPKKL